MGLVKLLCFLTAIRSLLIRAISTLLKLITNKSHVILFLLYSMHFYNSYVEMSTLKRLVWFYSEATLAMVT